jgi:hypothetical protein
MIPTVTTFVGQEWARGRLDSFMRVSDHIADVTRISSDEGALQFVVDPSQIDPSLLRQSRPTERGSIRKLEPPYNADERRFFERIDRITAKTVEGLLQPSPSQDGWASLSGANVLFMAGTTIPQFLGLEVGKAIRKVMSKAGREKPESLLYESAADDRLGAGLVTALRVYLGQEDLGPKRTDLIPHRLRAEPNTLVIGSFGIDPR